jgi:hypothetical protein
MKLTTRFMHGGSVIAEALLEAARRPVLSFEAWFAQLTPSEQAAYREADRANLMACAARLAEHRKIAITP